MGLQLQPFSLTYYLVHPVPADPVDVGFDSQNILQIVPVDIVRRSDLPCISDRITEKSHSGALPLAFDLRLRAKNAARNQDSGKGNDEFCSKFHLL